jgi:hypothetical protein
MCNPIYNIRNLNGDNKMTNKKSYQIKNIDTDEILFHTTSEEKASEFVFENEGFDLKIETVRTHKMKSRK